MPSPSHMQTTPSQTVTMQVQGPKGPADLATILNPLSSANDPSSDLANLSPSKSSSKSSSNRSANDERDSASFSSSDVSRKHTSASSSASIGSIYSSVISDSLATGKASSTSTITLPSSEKPPVQIRLVHLPRPSASVSTISTISSNTTTGGMSVASMMSPQSSTPAQLRSLDPYPKVDPWSGLKYSTDGSQTVQPVFERDGRRESVDSCMDQSFDDILLATSPYSSHHPSMSSISQIPGTTPSNVSVRSTANGAQRAARSVAPSLDKALNHRISNSYQPNAVRIPEPLPKAAKTAPAITGPATSTIARAAEPTKGFAWAFPCEDFLRVSTPSLCHESRRSSLSESLTSSQFTTEFGRLPLGQRSFDCDHIDTKFDQTRLFRHPSQQSLSQRSVVSIESAGQQPYSRSADGRATHMLAERKRRLEINDLFESLRMILPLERGTKSSKTEVLAKAIYEHQRHVESQRSLSKQLCLAQSENEHLFREIHGLKTEMAQLRSEMASYLHQQATDSRNSYPSRNEILPPIQSITTTGGSEYMTGLQYGVHSLQP